MICRVSIVQKVCVLICLGIFFTGCKENTNDPEEKVLSVCIMRDIVNLDPQVISGSNERKILSAIFEGLVVPDPKTYEPLPGVAESWSISEDGKVYEFYLRENTRWSNGDIVTADDFVFSAKRALSSKLGCSFVEMFLPIKNAKNFYERRIRDFSKVGISAIGKRILRIELEEPFSSFIYLIMQPCWYPLNEMVCESIRNCNEINAAWDNCYVNIVSNGPFVMTSRKFGKSISVEKNPYYWDYDNIKLSRIKLIIENNNVEIVRLFKNNIIDIAPYECLQNEDIDGMVDYNDVKSTARFGCCYFIFNTVLSPLSNRDVRTALAIAIRRENLLHLLEMNYGYAAYGLIPGLYEGDKVNKIFTENHEKACELLANAGYQNGVGFPKLKIICNDTKSCHLIADFLSKEYKTFLNIEVEVQYMRWDKFLSARKQGNFDIALGEWFGDYPDPMTFLNLFASHSQQNYCRWSNSEYDALLVEASRARDSRKRSEMIQRAEKLLIENMPILPLYFESSTYLIKNRVIGWDVNSMDIHSWKFISVKD